MYTITKNNNEIAMSMDSSSSSHDSFHDVDLTTEQDDQTIYESVYETLSLPSITSKEKPIKKSLFPSGVPNFSSTTFSTTLATTGETTPPGGPKQIRTYAKRWYILGVITSYVTVQYFTWNTFGPIASSVKEVYGWNNSDIAMLANWDTILYVIFALQVCWFVQKTGLRKSFVCSLFLVVLGSLARCVAVRESSVKWLMNTGQILNGLGGMLAQSVGPFISNTWFPPDERTTATAIATLASQCGLALSYVVGPSIVTEPKDMSLQTNMTSEKIKVKLFDELSVFMFLELIITVVLLAVAVVYFPNKPKLPPSNSASLSKLNFKDGFKQLLGKKSFWLILFIAASTTGIYSGWNAVLYLNLSTHNLNISQEECGWIGFASTLFSAAGGMILGYVSDRNPGHIRHLLLVLLAFAVCMFVWVAMICLQYFPYSLPLLYVPCLIGGFCINGSIPLMYEMIIELTYPVPETISIGFVGLVNNIFTFVFLLLFNIPNIGASWMNWSLIGSCAISLVLLLLFQEQYERMRIDSISLSSVHLEMANKGNNKDLSIPEDSPKEIVGFIV